MTGDLIMTVTVRPFLMFQGEAETTMALYNSPLLDAEIISITRRGPGARAQGRS